MFVKVLRLSQEERRDFLQGKYSVVRASGHEISVRSCSLTRDNDK